MGAYTSCISGAGPHMHGSAMVVAAASSLPERWQLPCEAIDVLIQHPLHEVVDGDEFLQTGTARPMGYGEPLKHKRVYILVPANQEGPVQEELQLQPQIIKGLKRLMGRRGTKRVLPVTGTLGPNEELAFAAL